MKSFLSRWGPAFALMLVIFFISGQPKTNIQDFGAWDWLVKNGGHFAGYLMLGIAMRRGVRGPAPARVQHLLWAFVLTALYALSDEYHQSFVPGRMSDAWDVIVDGAGATTGLALEVWWRPGLRQATPSPNKSESTRR